MLQNLRFFFPHPPQTAPNCRHLFSAGAGVLYRHPADTAADPLPVPEGHRSGMSGLRHLSFLHSPAASGFLRCRQGKSGDRSALSPVAGGISGSGAVESKVVRQGQQRGKSSAVGQRCCASAVRRCPQSSPYGISPAVLSAIALLFPSANIIKQYRLFLKITGILRA